MLHYETIDKGTLGLLKQLQGINFFSELRLVGGTSLALQLGHRISIDIDLFGTFDADEFEVYEKFNELGSVIVIKKSKNIFINIINEIKVDVVRYPYPWIIKPIITDKLLLASKEDIAAMKLAAITGRGSKKDFVDIYFLLQEFSLQQLFDFYDMKFHDGNRFLVLKSLTYFEDAERDQMPKMLIDVDWKTVKTFIKTLVNNFQPMKTNNE